MVGVRVDEALYQAIAELARREDRDVSNWLRREVKRIVAERLGDVPEPLPLFAPPASSAAAKGAAKRKGRAR